MEKKRKTFDCVEMKRRGAERLRMVTRGMTLDEELSFWKQGTDELRAQQDEMRRSRQMVQTISGQDEPEYRAIQFP